MTCPPCIAAISSMALGTMTGIPILAPGFERATSRVKSPRSRVPSMAWGYRVFGILRHLVRRHWFGRHGAMGEIHLDWLRKYVRLANGIPAHDTLNGGGYGIWNDLSVWPNVVPGLFGSV